MNSENKRIALFPGLDGTGLLLISLKDKLPDFEVDIVEYDDSLIKVADIVTDIESRIDLESYTHFFAESFGTLILSQLLTKNKLSGKPSIFLAPFLQVPMHFQLMLKMPNFLINKTYKKILATPLLSHYCLGESSTKGLKHSVNQVVAELDPIALTHRLRAVRQLNFSEAVFKNSIVILTKLDRLIPISEQRRFADKFSCKNERTIEAPHFSALTHTSVVAEIINSL